MTATRSASWSASSRYWVVRSTVQPSATSSRMVSHICPRVRGSRPVVGSSRKISGGRLIRLAARSSRRRMPPEYFAMALSPASSRPNRPRRSSAVVRACFDDRPRRRPNSQRFSRPVRFSSTEAYCPVTPSSWRMTWGCWRTSTPNSSALPPSIGSRVASIWSIVVLPAPFGPSTPKTSPRYTSRSMPSTARRSPKVLTSPRAWTAVSAVGEEFVVVMRPRSGSAVSARLHDGFTRRAPGFSAPLGSGHG